MYQPLKEPASLSHVLDNGFRLFGAAFTRIWALALLGALVPFLLFFPIGFFGASFGNQLGPALAILIIPMAILAVAISIGCMGAIIARLDAIAQGQELGFGAALKLGVRRSPILFASLLLYMLAISLGMLLLIIPGLYLMISLMLCTYLIMVEKSGPIEALKRSYRLVQGNWWRTMAALMVPTVLMMTVMGLAQMLVVMVSIPFGEEAVAMTMLISQGVNIIVQVIATPLIYAMVLALYYDLRLRKEGDDLEARIESIEEAPVDEGTLRA